MKRCALCNKPILRTRHGVKYCDAICARDARCLYQSINYQQGYVVAIMDLLLERGDNGAQLNGQPVEKIISWQWVMQDDDGYVRLTEHGKRAYQEFRKAS